MQNKTTQICQNQSLFQLGTLSLHTELMNASHSTNVFTNSCDHISSNGKAALHSHMNHNNPQFLYSVNLKCKDNVKYLGVLIDCSLSWKLHTEHIVVKISRLGGIIAKFRHFVPRNTLLRIYESLILPYISYGLTAWGLASKCYLKKVLVLAVGRQHLDEDITADIQKRVTFFVNRMH